jgi:lipoprotein-anchoring transpeptidase ErfK/SrfK
MFRTLNFHAAMVPLFALLGLGACGGVQPDVTRAVQAPPPAVVAMYQPVVDGEYLIPGVHPGYLTGRNARTTVEWTGREGPGTIVVDPHARVLYHVHEGGVATRYGIAVGREGYGFSGSATVRRKAEWPSWTPTANMIRREPEVYAQFAGGLEGGLENPLGARALYLYRGGRDTMYRIHGTNSVSSIGRATSAGCIRLFNQDIIHLYDQIRPGAPVRVRTRADSIAAEGRMVEGPTGLMVPVDSAQGQAILAGQVEVAIIN